MGIEGAEGGRSRTLLRIKQNANWFQWRFTWSGFRVRAVATHTEVVSLIYATCREHRTLITLIMQGS